MEKNAVVRIVALVALVAGIVLYVWLSPTPAKAPVQESTIIANPYVEQATYYDIAANYPTSTPLMGEANGAAVEIIQSWIIDTVSQFKKDGHFENLTPEDITMMGFDQGRKESLEITYLISSSPRTVSYIFTIYMDTLGAHPNGYFKTFTFDTKTGVQVMLDDVFAPGSDYLGALSSMARAKLPGVIGKERADTDYIESGTEPKKENFQNFFFDNGTLDILFPPYQVGPYAIGPQTLPIPLADLAGILQSEYKP